MALAERKVKDQEQASRMKANGEERESGMCCLCYRMVPNGRPQNGNDTHMSIHLMNCAAKTPAGSTKAHRYREATIRRRIEGH